MPFVLFILLPVSVSIKLNILSVSAKFKLKFLSVSAKIKLKFLIFLSVSAKL